MPTNTELARFIFTRNSESLKFHTDLKIIHFLAQVISESGSFRYVSEIGATDSDYKGFKGRGLIQLTGIDNYKSYEDYENEDFTSSTLNKQKLENLPYAIRSAGWFWSIKAELNDDSDRNDFITFRYYHHQKEGNPFFLETSSFSVGYLVYRKGDWYEKNTFKFKIVSCT